MKQTTFTQEEKNNWVAIGEIHQEQDRFIQGNWLDDKDDKGVFKGCFFGCFMQSDENVLISASKEMNIPEWLVSVSEKIFEGLPEEDSMKFPLKLLKSIPTDEDITDKWKSWNYALLMDE